MGEGSVVRQYECLREGGGCGQVFFDCKPAHSYQAVMCPNCSMDGSETFVDEDGIRRHRVAWLPPRLHQGKDIDSMDGASGRIPMPALGPNVTVGSRRELKDALVRAREQYFNSTQGAHATLRPFVDPHTGETVFDTVTTVKDGVDLGELHPIESRETAQEQRSPFDPSLSADQHIRKLEESTGSGMEHPVDHTARKGGYKNKKRR